MRKLLIAKLMLLACVGQTSDQQAYMVWPAKCVEELRMTADAQLIAPMKNGTPDKAKAKFEGLVVSFDDNCKEAHLVIRKEK